jgi:hypothetical protein
MSEQSPDVFSANGHDPEAAIGIADPPDSESPTTDAEPAPPAMADESPTTDAAAPDGGATFLAELAGAMRATAANERKRIDEDIDRRREEHLGTINERRDSEAARMRELAADDLKAIDAWAQGERQRIDEEREQKATALQQDLDTSLAQHASQIDGEVAGAEAAIAGYRQEVEAFFAKLDAETDPVEIARLASQRPAFPDLATAPAAQPATPAADAGQVPVGVMDAETAADPATAWSQWNASTESADGSPAATDAPAPVATATSTLFHAVPVDRPYAGLIGDRAQDQ